LSDLFEARFDVLLYDLTSTYFECAVPWASDDPRRLRVLWYLWTNVGIVCIQLCNMVLEARDVLEEG
jgi:hypothetical protein